MPLLTFCCRSSDWSDHSSTGRRLPHGFPVPAHDFPQFPQCPHFLHFLLFSSSPLTTCPHPPRFFWPLLLVSSSPCSIFHRRPPLSSPLSIFPLVRHPNFS